MGDQVRGGAGQIPFLQKGTGGARVAGKGGKFSFDMAGILTFLLVQLDSL